MQRVQERRQKWHPKAGAPGGRKGPQGQTVIRAPSGNELVPAFLPLGHMNLPGKLDGGFHRLGTAGHKIKTADTLRCMFGQLIGQFLHGLVGKHGRMEVVSPP